jgi:hypothetical protein
MRNLVIAIAVVAVAVVCGTATAAAAKKLKLTPGVFDPDNSGIVTAAWQANAGLEGHGLFLQKDGPTATFAAAGGDISGVEGITLTELGFDYRNDSHCTGGAPRFNVDASDGFHFMGGCGNGTQTVLNANWNRVRIDPYNPAQAFPVLTPGATINSITIILDEGTDSGPGFAYLDNIDVNGTLIGKPGNAK